MMLCNDVYFEKALIILQLQRKYFVVINHFVVSIVDITSERRGKSMVISFPAFLWDSEWCEISISALVLTLGIHMNLSVRLQSESFFFRVVYLVGMRWKFCNDILSVLIFRFIIFFIFTFGSTLLNIPLYFSISLFKYLS